MIWNFEVLEKGINPPISSVSQIDSDRNGGARSGGSWSNPLSGRYETLLGKFLILFLSSENLARSDFDYSNLF